MRRQLFTALGWFFDFFMQGIYFLSTFWLFASCHFQSLKSSKSGQKVQKADWHICWCNTLHRHQLQTPSLNIFMTALSLHLLWLKSISFKPITIAPVPADVGTAIQRGTVTEYIKEALSRAYSRKMAASNSGGRQKEERHFLDREETSPGISWATSPPASLPVTLIPMSFGTLSWFSMDGRPFLPWHSVSGR